MKKKTYYSYIILDQAVKEKVHAVMMCANNREQAVGFFRATLGLYYLSKIMVEQELDFKKIDQEFNVFIYRTLGKGHSITSILQYMSSKKVLWVLDAKSFIPTFLNYFPDIPFRNIPLLLSINLSVSKKISGIATAGPVQDWTLEQTRRIAQAESGAAQQPDAPPDRTTDDTSAPA
ncbi:hypothetical protein ACFOFO_07430 [Undibacterium arcticum]|uniref:Uncharacterized protein n=1 Tax=Undibacterium arcticum TaxID=1762892 RepID=A0ABV7EYE2_9BURK